jgi:hypothetical protein
LGNLLRFGIAVELTNQPFGILGGALGQIVDEIFDQIPAGFPECSGAAIVGGIGLHEASIEVVLANDQAETVAKARLAIAIVMAVVSVRGGFRLIE